MKQKRVRKPKDFQCHTNCDYYDAVIMDGYVSIQIDRHFLREKSCRKLAAWLISAADYLEQEKQKRRG